MTSDREPGAKVVHPDFAQEMRRPPTSIGGWRVDAKANTLERGDAAIRLEPRVMSLLLTLASRPGRTFTRVELIDSVWSDVVVNDDALSTAVSKLRRVFEEAPDVAVETIPRVGYRLLTTTTIATTTGEPAPSPSTKWFGPFAGVGVVATLIALTVITLRSNDAPREAAPARGVIAALTSAPGMEVDPAPAPGPSDRRVAYAWKGPDQSNWDIWLTLGDGSPPARLTTGAAAEVRPAWSPDGNRIAFVSIDGNHAAIHTISSLGGDQRTAAVVEAGSTFDLDWSPDGSTLIFPDRATTDAPWGIVAVDVASGTRRTITSPDRGIGDIAAAWSPDGLTIAVVRSPVLGVEDLWLQPLDGPATPLTTEGRKIHGADWTNDGKEIVFASNRGGMFTLWSVSVTDGAVRPVSAGSIGADGPRIGGDGSITFVQWNDRADLSRIDPASGTHEELVPSTRYDWSPSLSGDGRLAFVSDRSGTPELWTADVAMASVVRQTRFDGPLVMSAAWSPDGSSIAFDARPDGNADVFVVAPASGVRHRIAPTSFDELNASWSEDGRRILFASNRTGRWEIWSARPDGSELAQVTTAGGYRAIEAGGALFVARADVPGLWLVRDGSEEIVIDDLHPIDSGNWTVAAGSIWYVQRPTPYTPRLARFDLDTRTTSVVTELEAMLDHGGLAVSRDGRSVWVSRIVSREADIFVARD